MTRCRILCLFCLIFLGCSDLSDIFSSDDSQAVKMAKTHGSGLFVYLAVHCERDMSCRSSVRVKGTPSPKSEYKYGFHYTFIAGNDTLVAESDRFIDSGDTLPSWNFPVTDGHVRFSLLDKKKKHKDYDIDLAPWLGEASPSQYSVAFTNFEVGSRVCFYKVQGESYCQTIQEGTEKITVPNDSTFYPFFRVWHNDFYFDVGKYTDELYLWLTAYWR